MTALYIAGGIILILAFLLFLKVRFTFSWCRGILLELKIGFITIRKEFKPFSHFEEDDEPVPETEKTPEPVKKEKSKSVSVKQIIPIIRETLSFLVKKLKKHLRIEKYIIKINVASDDPSKTAILYGAVSASAASLQTYIDGLKNVSGKKGNVYTEVTPDFISEKTDIYVDISLSVRVWQALSLLSTVSGGYKKYRILKSGKEE